MTKNQFKLHYNKSIITNLSAIETLLSSYIWKLKSEGLPFSVNWSILARVKHTKVRCDVTFDSRKNKPVTITVMGRLQVQFPLGAQNFLSLEACCACAFIHHSLHQHIIIYIYIYILYIYIYLTAITYELEPYIKNKSL